MILNAESLLQFLPNGLGEFGAKAQVGIDLSIKNITKIIGGKVYQNGKKEIDKYEEVDNYIDKEGDKEIKTWILDPGVYSLTFHQSVKLDSKHTAFIRHKSTLLRIGCEITSGVFDPGFECEEIGATLFCFNRGIEIQEGAKLAQFLVFENEESELYNGNYQGSKDLK